MSAAWFIALVALAAGVSTSPMERLAAGFSPIRVGEWVTFRVAQGAQEQFFRLSVVGELSQQGDSPRALDVAFEAGLDPQIRSPLIALRLRWPRNAAGGLDALAVVQGWASVGGGPTQPFPHAFEPTWLLGRARGDIRQMAGVRVRTGKGVVRSARVDLVYNSQVVQRMWMSEAVPLLHLARVEIPALQYVVEATDYGWDAPARVPLEGGRRETQP